MYLKFDVVYQPQLDDLKSEINQWATRYDIRYTSKTIKNTHRVGFNHDEHFSLFSMTWNPEYIELRPWLKFQIVNIANERY